MLLQEPVQAAIWHCLNHYDHKDAIFLAERLCTEVESDETIFILATSYYRSNLIHQTYWLLREKARRAPQCRYLHAKAAYQLKKYSEAESALIQSGFGDMNTSIEEIAKEFGEIACFVLQLIAQICVKTERNKIAVVALRKALKLNPFLWQAYADLCHLGEYPDGGSIFKIPSTDIFNTCHGNTNTSSMILFGASNMAEATNNGGRGGSLISNNLISQLSNSSNYIFTTPVDQPIPAALAKADNLNNLSILQNVATPNHNNSSTSNNLNSSISMLRGNTSGLGSNNDHGGCDETAVGYTNTSEQRGGGMNLHGNDTGIDTPFCKQFKYLSSVVPTTPSFGVLPITSPAENNVTSFLEGCLNFNNLMQATTENPLNATNSPPAQTLAEVNKEHKNANKKTKSHIGNIINRKESTPNSGSGSKPAVFTQAGNITPRTPNNNSGITSTGPTVPNAAVRRSSRLFGNNAYSVKENTKSPNIANKFAQPRSPPRKTKTRTGKICLNNELIEDKMPGTQTATQSMPEKQVEKNLKKDKEKIETITSATTTVTAAAAGNNSNSNNRSTSSSQDQNAKVQLNNSLNNAQTMANHLMMLKKQSADGLMTLLRDLSEGYKQLVHYHCKTAIRHFVNIIPKHHLCSSWVQSLIGMCYYELRQYEEAVAIFKQIHESEPYRLDSMEIYSSSLWQLQREVDLSALAQDLMNQDKTSAITWCVAGNCFSLHKEHETAIKFFKRAVQVDTDFVYSYTLLGHELVLTEELDKAMEYFRAAVVRDPRHYNAWFGIGTIYSKQEKYELAELHYIKALKINPQNSVIMVHIGAMQYFMQKKEQALHTIDTAAILDPKNPLARFHRGSIYFSLGKYQEALRELEELKELVPKESVVFYLIGKIYKTLGNVDLALMHFSWATDLDPKGANNQVKDAFDSMSHPTSCPTLNETSLDVDLEPISERSDDSIQAQDINYDSDF